MEIIHHRTIWLSDMHLGTRGCSADRILEFLDAHDAATIYLVGDIIDGWRLARRFFWPRSHNDVVHRMLQKARAGTKIIWLVGNHDEFVGPYIGNNFGGIAVVAEYVHETADGRSFLVIHGDKFDVITQYHRWLARLGDVSYDALLAVNRRLMRLRSCLGFHHWSLSDYVKRRVKQAACFISQYEQTIAEECRQREFDGIICGHIHHAVIKQIGGDVLYCNSGDWVESCTALVEDFAGNLAIIHHLAAATRA